MMSILCSSTPYLTQTMAMSEYRQITVTDRDGISVVRFVSEKIVDELEIQELGDELTSLIEKDKRVALLLNFDGVRFLSSAALGKLIKLDQLVKQHESKLKFSNIRSDVYEVFKITKLDTVFDIRETEADALAGFVAG
jgi:anti-sigma B factor antagonist